MSSPVGQIRRPAGEHVVAVAHVQRQPVVDEGLAHPLVVLELGRGLHGVVVEAVLFQPVARRAAHGLDLRRVLAGQPLVQQVGQQTVVAVPVLAALALETLDEQVVLYQEVHLRRHFRAREPRDALGHRQTEGIDHRRAGQETLPFRLQNREHLFEQVVVDAALCAFDGFAHLALRSVAAQKRHQLAAGNPPLRRFLYGLRFVLRKPYAQLREQRARLFQGKAQMGLGHLHQLARHLHLGGGKVQRLARRDDEVRVGGQMLHQVTHAFADVLAGAHLVEVLKHAHEVAPVFGDLENEVVEHGTHVLEAAGHPGLVKRQADALVGNAQGGRQIETVALERGVFGVDAVPSHRHVVERGGPRHDRGGLAESGRRHHGGQRAGQGMRKPLAHQGARKHVRRRRRHGHLRRQENEPPRLPFVAFLAHVPFLPFSPEGPATHACGRTVLL